MSPSPECSTASCIEGSKFSPIVPISSTCSPSKTEVRRLLKVSSSFENRLLQYDVPPEEVLSRDKKSLIIDNYVRWRIIDPLKFLQKALIKTQFPTPMQPGRGITSSQGQN